MKWLIGIGIIFFISIVSVATRADDGTDPAQQKSPSNQLQSHFPPAPSTRPVGIKPQGAPNRGSSADLDPSSASSMGAGIKIPFGKVKKSPPAPTHDDTDELEEN